MNKLILGALISSCWVNLACGMNNERQFFDAVMQQPQMPQNINSGYVPMVLNQNGQPVPVMFCPSQNVVNPNDMQYMNQPYGLFGYNTQEPYAQEMTDVNMNFGPQNEDGEEQEERKR